jgi:hypothetical protein
MTEIETTLPPEVSIYLGSDQVITFEANGDLRYLGKFVENNPGFYKELTEILNMFSKKYKEVYE